MGEQELVAGMADEQRRARADKLDADNLAAALAAFRAGDSDARQRLINGLRYLVYGDRPERLGARYIALVTAVDRLAENDAPDAEKFARDELRRAVIEQAREASRNILPPSSTNSCRLHRGQRPYHKLTRVESDPVSEGDGFETPSALEDGGKPPLEDQTGRPYVQPSRLTDMATELYDLKDELCRDEVEADVLQMLVDGFDERTIAATLSITKHRVQVIKERFRQRAGDRPGLADSA